MHASTTQNGADGTTMQRFLHLFWDITLDRRKTDSSFLECTYLTWEKKRKKKVAEAV